MAAITLRDILVNLKADALLAPQTSHSDVGQLAFFSNEGKHGELALLDRYLADTLSAQCRIIPITEETASFHGLSLLAHILTIQLDPTQEAHFWIGKNIVQALGALQYVEPKERHIWLNKIDHDALLNTILLVSKVCGTEFCASITLHNTTFDGMVKKIRHSVPGRLGLLFVGIALSRQQATALLRHVPSHMAVGGFLALPPETVALPEVKKTLMEAGIHPVGEVSKLMSIFQKTSSAMPF